MLHVETSRNVCQYSVHLYQSSQMPFNNTACTNYIKKVPHFIVAAILSCYIHLHNNESLLHTIALLLIANELLLPRHINTFPICFWTSSSQSEFSGWNLTPCLLLLPDSTHLKKIFFIPWHNYLFRYDSHYICSLNTGLGRLSLFFTSTKYLMDHTILTFLWRHFDTSCARLCHISTSSKNFDNQNKCSRRWIATHQLHVSNHQNITATDFLCAPAAATVINNLLYSLHSLWNTVWACYPLRHLIVPLHQQPAVHFLSDPPDL